ncbi:MAG: hypothetical protein AAGE86_00075 [Pseudomonadota bacterium]
MKFVFWSLAAIGVGSIGVVSYIERVGNPAELLEYDPYSRAIQAAGMPPQIELIKQAAEDYSWEVRCEGSSGRMTVLHLVPKLWAWPTSDQKLYDEIAAVSSSTGLPMQRDICDHPADHFFGKTVGDRSEDALAIGTREEIEPLLPIAKACELEGLRFRPLTDAENEFYQPGEREELVALSVSLEEVDMAGPVFCTLLIANREFAEAEPVP